MITVKILSNRENSPSQLYSQNVSEVLTWYFLDSFSCPIFCIHEKHFSFTFRHFASDLFCVDKRTKSLQFLLRIVFPFRFLGSSFPLFLMSLVLVRFEVLIPESINSALFYDVYCSLLKGTSILEEPGPVFNIT